MAWFYEQRTGRIWRNNEPVLATGYAGAPGAVNDPAKQRIKNTGPLPRGVYTILPAITHPRLGPIAMKLEPFAGNEMFDRDDFWIHGDNSAMNRTGSMGCPVLGRQARATINRSTDKTLVVF